MLSFEVKGNGRVPPSLTETPINSFNLLKEKTDPLSTFFNFDTLTKPGAAEEKAVWKRALDEAYSDISTELNPANKEELLPLMAKVLTYNAHRLYGGDMNLTRLFFLAGLSLQLSNEGNTQPLAVEYICQESTLDGLTARIASHAISLNCLQEELVKTLDIGKMIASCANEQELFDLAANLDWLGRCCQNLPNYNRDAPLFKMLYGLAREAYKYLIETTCSELIKKNANWQIADNLYNTERHVYSLEHPGDFKGKLATLNQLAPYLEAENGSLRAVIKAAQVQNIMAMEMWGTLDHFPVPTHPMIKEIVFNHAQQALTIAQQKEEEGFDSFLLSMFYNNVASFGLESNKLTAAEAQVYSDTAIAKAQEQGLDHYYFAGYFKVGASIAKALGDEEKAAALEVQAQAINTKFGR